VVAAELTVTPKIRIRKKARNSRFVDKRVTPEPVL
jgi:hypothetical protein